MESAGRTRCRHRARRSDGPGGRPRRTAEGGTGGRRRHPGDRRDPGRAAGRYGRFNRERRPGSLSRSSLTATRPVQPNPAYFPRRVSKRTHPHVRCGQMRRTSSSVRGPVRADDLVRAVSGAHLRHQLRGGSPHSPAALSCRRPWPGPRRCCGQPPTRPPARSARWPRRPVSCWLAAAWIGWETGPPVIRSVAMVAGLLPRSRPAAPGAGGAVRADRRSRATRRGGSSGTR